MAKQKILVVEDDASVAELIRTFLERSGYEVAGVFGSGEAALKAAPQLRPVLAIMDINLRGKLDGVETASRLRDRFNLPVVFVTGLADDETVQRSQAAQAFGYLLKPFRQEDLNASIQLALSKHHLESKLHQTEYRFSAALRSIGDAVITVDDQDRITFLNPMGEALTRHSFTAAAGRKLDTVLRLVDGQTRAPGPTLITPSVRRGSVSTFSPQTLLIARGGAEIFIEGSAGPIRDDQGTIVGGVVIFRDVTERRRAEQALNESREELRALAAHGESVREEERTRIAREIHDELGQLATALRYDLAWIERGIAAVADKTQREGLHGKTESAMQLLDRITQSVRKIAAELRPGVLDDLGLAPALEWQAREFQTRTGIQCSFTSSIGEISVSPELGTAAFRIFQETLTNVMRHAKATAVSALLRAQGGQLILEVKDNGRGISSKEKAGAKSFGLIGMKERAKLLGGSFMAEGASGLGTIVTVALPLNPPRRGLSRATDGATPSTSRPRSPVSF